MKSGRATTLFVGQGVLSIIAKIIEAETFRLVDSAASVLLIS